MNKNIKKLIFILTIITTFLCINSTMFAYDDSYYENGIVADGNAAAGGDVGYVNTKEVHSSSGTGTVYHTTVNGTTVNMVIPGGQSVGNLNGYHSMSENNYTIPEGDIVIEAEDFATALEAYGYPELAEEIRKGESYEVYTEQVIKVAAPGEKGKWMTVGEIEQKAKDQEANGVEFGPGRIDWDMWTPVKNSEEAWSDYREGIDGKGHYYGGENPPPPSGDIDPSTSGDKDIDLDENESVNQGSNTVTAYGEIKGWKGQLANVAPTPTTENVSVKAYSNFAGIAKNIVQKTYTYSVTIEIPWEYNEPVYDASGEISDYVFHSGTAISHKSTDFERSVTVFTSDDVFTPVNSIMVSNGDIGLSLSKNVSVSWTSTDNTNFEEPDKPDISSYLYDNWEDAQNKADDIVEDLMRKAEESLKDDELWVNGQKIDYIGNVTLPNVVEYNLGTYNIPSGIRNETGAGYPSAGTHDLGQDFIVNSVQVHTPIYNSLSLNLNGKYNQYKNDGKTNIVTLGDEFSVSVNLSGNTKYYGTLNTNKYKTSVSIHCGVCGKNDGATHTCKVPITITDNKPYTITSTVKAINSKSTDAQPSKTTNDSQEYIITQSKQVYVVGKIFDLQVRTTDDPGWKLTTAQKLASLAIGEKGDNAITAYKYGIKLGYRAYFDLKTLGTATNEIELKPKIYYLNVAGQDITSSVDFYYRTATGYKKLSANDIVINMTMNTTRGAVNNSNFNDEKARMLYLDKTINYAKKIQIGGLSGITLNKDNSVITRYNSSYVNPLNASRRWVGEIYLPASLVVVDKNIVNEANANTMISKGTGVIKTQGYLLITFSDIYTTGSNLQYSMVRNSAGSTSGVAYSNALMYKEKNNKNAIILPNGATFNIPQKEASVIIYDALLKANNDYESSGTH